MALQSFSFRNNQDSEILLATIVNMSLSVDGSENVRQDFQEGSGKVLEILLICSKPNIILYAT